MWNSTHKSESFFPKELKCTSLTRPQYRFAMSDQFTAGIWHDRRDVTFLSAIHSASVEIVQKRPKRGKEAYTAAPLL